MGFVSRGGGEVVRWGPGHHHPHQKEQSQQQQQQQREQAGNEDEDEEDEEDENEEEEKWKGGLAAGEEVLNHYCDVDLSVRARREWAGGALGGWCLCERCVWEEGEEEREEEEGRRKQK